MKRREAKTGTMQLTPRQVTFAESLAEGTTLTDAARRAGYSEKNLAQPGHQGPNAIWLNASELMDCRGLALEDFIKNHLIPQLSATTKKVIRNKGKVTQVCEIPDNSARLRAVRFALWLHGALPSKRIPNLLSRRAGKSS